MSRFDSLTPASSPVRVTHLCRTASRWLHSQLAPFSGSIPAAYDRYLGPMLFQPYAEDLSWRVLAKARVYIGVNLFYSGSAANRLPFSPMKRFTSFLVIGLAYRIDVRLATVGRTIGVGGGVQSDSGRECASFFGILSQKEGKTWKPRKNDHYKYEPEVEPKDWQALGTFKVDTIYQNEAKATFQWKPGSEGKAVSVRWHITGDDKETFEDVWTDWLTQSNPCPPSTGSSSGGSQETATPAAATPVATPLSDETTNRPSRVPTSEASYTSAPGMLTQKQALLNRAKRSNDAVTGFYNSLISRLPIAAQEQLKKQQDKWLEMRRTEAGSEELLAQGSNADPNVLRRFAEMNEARAIVLKTTLRGK